MDLTEFSNQTAKDLQGELGPFVARVAAPAPATAASDLFVTIFSFDGGRSPHGPCLWEPPAGALPALGELCVVVRAIEEDGEGEQNVVIAFDRDTTGATQAAVDALDTRVDSLEGQTKIALPFAAGWANTGGGSEDCSYSRVGRLVVVQGAATKTSGAPAFGNLIATLPAGYRPTESLLFPVLTQAGTAFGTVAVSAVGEIVWIVGAVGETDLTSLSGISYVVD